MNMAVLKEAAPVKQGVADKVSLTIKQRKDKFGLYLKDIFALIKRRAIHFSQPVTMAVSLKLMAEVVNNDGNHGSTEKEGKCFLEKGYHKIRLRYFDSAGDNNLSFSYQPLGQTKIEVPASMLYH
jgi:hypothetical protein